jgi:hypothetical protein
MPEPRTDHETPRRQGQRDLLMIGVGIIVLGALGFIGVILAIDRWNFPDGGIAVTVAGGAILMVLAGCMITAFAIRARRGAEAGPAGGCGSVALTVALGGLLFVAAFVFLFATCFAIVMSDLRVH